jgi:hypothetical protein
VIATGTRAHGKSRLYRGDAAINQSMRISAEQPAVVTGSWAKS